MREFSTVLRFAWASVQKSLLTADYGEPVHLFADFITNDASYAAAEKFWSALADEVAAALGQGGEWRSWYPRFYGDRVTPMERDGNPICERRSDRLGKAFKIIQWPPGSTADDAAWMTAWVKEWAGDPLAEGAGLPDAELVVSLVLTEQSAGCARELLTSWMTPQTTVAQMSEQIDGSPDLGGGGA
jgi:hypothetical protein